MSDQSDQKHAFLVAGTHSGCGKTTITLGLIAALKARGLRVQPFKTGPDFIDPGLHAQIAGTSSRNLDGWMLSRDYNVGLFRRLMAGSDLGIVEGVMGLFDGYEGGTESGSSAEMAKWLGIPAILVVDARSMARSAAALLYGFKNFDPALNLCAVIFNRVGGQAHLDYLKEAVGTSFPDLAVLGGIPREESVQIPERHLGLVTADEMGLDHEWRQKLAGLIGRYLNLDLLLQNTVYAGKTVSTRRDDQRGREQGAGAVDDRPGGDQPRPYGIVDQPRPGIADQRHPHGAPRRRMRETPPASPIIAVARDSAFCFYYPDNLELLEKSGAIPHYFSPVAGEDLPAGCSGVYLGGGYPELFAEAISANSAFLESLWEAAANGMPIYAECGGLMTLGRFIDTIDGARFPMAGILPFGTRMLARRRALGYTEVVLRKPCLLGGPGLKIRGHEFHYSEIADFETADLETAGLETADFETAGLGTADPREADHGLEFAYELRARKFEQARNEGYMPARISSAGRRRAGKPTPPDSIPSREQTPTSDPLPSREKAGRSTPLPSREGLGEGGAVPVERDHVKETPAPRVLASYIHLHWGSAPEAAFNFVARCAEWKDGR